MLSVIHWILIVFYVAFALVSVFTFPTVIPSSLWDAFHLVSWLMGLIAIVSTGFKRRVLPKAAWFIVLIILLISVWRYWPNFSVFSDPRSKPYWDILIFSTVFGWLPVFATVYLLFFKYPKKRGI